MFSAGRWADSSPSGSTSTTRATSTASCSRPPPAGGPGSTPPDPDAWATHLGGGPAALLGLLFPLPAEQAASDAYVASITRWSDFSLSIPPDVLSAQLATSAQWFAHGASLKRIHAATLV